VSVQVIREAQAIDQAAGFLSDDPDGVREMLDAVARLTEEPRPATVTDRNSRAQNPAI